MEASDVTVEWLRSIPFEIYSAQSVPTIADVVLRELHVHLDGRGDVTELWSKPWIEAEGLSGVEHVYQSATDFGVIKCWHLHGIHTDQLTVTRGKLQITLVDLREGSPSFGHVDAFFVGSLQPRLVKIPPMVMHGWKALSAPEVLVVNLQSHVYAPSDEYKFPWDCVLADIWEPKHG
ncbi:MAG: dTDP-4-dehydrorhamnose 3,5-epimerase family protein [Anaerolineae bacterium]|jgi:dTDP-4-dehydrorhamnose 3,5-epimerase